MEFAKERKKHLTYLKKIRARPLEVQNVLTFTVDQFENETRLEYMAFVETNKLQHSWAALLAWWRYRKHTPLYDKSKIQSMKRRMEIKKKEEYTLLNTSRKLKERPQSPPLATVASPPKILPNKKTHSHNDDDDDKGPPPPPPPPSSSPPQKKKDSPTNVIAQKLIMRMSPRDWHEFLQKHEYQAATLLPDLRKFLHTKYIHEENTGNRNKYGQLCNLAEYPLTHRPYEEDFSAKRKLEFDPTSPIDQPKCNRPDTFINRSFSGSVFPAYMSKEEYMYKCLTPHDVILPSYVDNRYELITTSPADPGLYRINEHGKMVQVL